MMTAFTRIFIVLALLRQALGTQKTPTNQTLVGLALYLPFFVMATVCDTIHETAEKEDVPFSVLVPSFITSESKTAFQIGFMIFIPFLIFDLVVASVLMAMGMMMLSPLIISLPFKIMLFVLVDGWVLIVGTLATSFYT